MTKKRIENLTRLIEGKLPGAAVSVDAPSRPGGDWFMDVKYGDQSFAVEYRPSLGLACRRRLQAATAKALTSSSRRRRAWSIGSLISPKPSRKRSLRWADESGATRTERGVYEFNESARAFWHSVGFQTLSLRLVLHSKLET